MTKEPLEGPPSQLDIELPEEVAAGHYINLAVIGHSPTEFVVDFIQVMPGLPKGKVRTRVILAPMHAKRLLRALQDNIQKYESAFGTIEEGGPMGGEDFIMGGPPAQA